MNDLEIENYINKTVSEKLKKRFYYMTIKDMKKNLYMYGEIDFLIDSLESISDKTNITDQVLNLELFKKSIEKIIYCVKDDYNFKYIQSIYFDKIKELKEHEKKADILIKEMVAIYNIS